MKTVLIHFSIVLFLQQFHFNCYTVKICENMVPTFSIIVNYTLYLINYRNWIMYIKSIYDFFLKWIRYCRTFSGHFLVFSILSKKKGLQNFSLLY